MSIFISLGPNCSTRAHIQSYNNVTSQITLFFDWLIVDFESVIQCFTHHASFDDFFSSAYIVRRGLHKFNSHMSFTRVPTCDFLHDLPMKYTHEEFDEFVAKYKRRFARILEHIHSSVPLYFVFKGPITHDERARFIDVIKQINPACNFTLVHITNTPQLLQACANYIHINITQFLLNDVIPNHQDWKEQHYDWNACFDVVHTLARPNTT
jgi:hypothetical protein